MKALEEQDHYEVLEVPRGARREDIERAYPIVRAAYSPESLATYSVFGSSESGAIRERIDLAYRTLTDPSARESYDAELGIVQNAQERAFEELRESIPTAVDVVPTIDALDELDELEDEASGEYDGARLRRARMHRGVEIDHISEVTRISTKYLKCIEEDAFGTLPAAVYTRGFVTAYARVVALDPQLVAKSSKKRVEEARGAGPSGRIHLTRR